MISTLSMSEDMIGFPGTIYLSPTDVASLTSLIQHITASTDIQGLSFPSLGTNGQLAFATNSAQATKMSSKLPGVLEQQMIISHNILLEHWWS